AQWPCGTVTVCAGGGSCGSGEHDTRRGDDQAAGEYFPLREYRAGERAEADVSAHGHGYLGSDRRRGDQAFWLHALLSWPGTRRTLHSRRSVLSFLESAGI